MNSEAAAIRAVRPAQEAAMLAQYRAQIGGKGDADLKRALREAVPGYRRNLEELLRLKP